VLLYNHEYFDPFGVVPTIAISKFVDKYNDQDYQNYKSMACGYYAIYAFDNICKGLDPYHKLTKDTLKNETVLQRYFR
jgi:hypothetical protein